MSAEQGTVALTATDERLRQIKPDVEVFAKLVPWATDVHRDDDLGYAEASRVWRSSPSRTVATAAGWASPSWTVAAAVGWERDEEAGAWLESNRNVRVDTGPDTYLPLAQARELAAAAVEAADLLDQR